MIFRYIKCCLMFSVEISFKFRHKVLSHQIFVSLSFRLSSSSSFLCSVCEGVGRDREPEQYSGSPWPGGHLALLLHHQCCSQQPQHHLDGHTAVQCQPARAGTQIHTHYCVVCCVARRNPTQTSVKAFLNSLFEQLIQEGRDRELDEEAHVSVG